MAIKLKPQGQVLCVLGPGGSYRREVRDAGSGLLELEDCGIIDIGMYRILLTDHDRRISLEHERVDPVLNGWSEGKHGRSADPDWMSRSDQDGQVRLGSCKNELA